MAALMSAIRPELHCEAPVWAWHSCGGWQCPPDDERMRSLLSEAELRAGVVLLELRVPAELTVLSVYGVWNTILDRFFDAATAGSAVDTAITQAERKKLLAVKRGDAWGDDTSRDIQATLPLLRREWIANMHVKS
jgi:hypothetical protein